MLGLAPRHVGRPSQAQLSLGLTYHVGRPEHEQPAKIREPECLSDAIDDVEQGDARIHTIEDQALEESFKNLYLDCSVLQNLNL